MQRTGDHPGDDAGVFALVLLLLLALLDWIAVLVKQLLGLLLVVELLIVLAHGRLLHPG